MLFPPDAGGTLLPTLRLRFLAGPHPFLSGARHLRTGSGQLLFGTKAQLLLGEGNERLVRALLR
jgi:hypothetical protein